MRSPSPHAFTLVELLVVLALLSIFATISLSAFTSARQSTRFKEEFSQLVDLIQDTRSKALSNATLNTSGETAVAFYLTFDSGSSVVSLYADTTTDELLEEVEFSSMFTCSVSPGDLERIEYRPPAGDLELVFTSESSTGTDVTEVAFFCTDGRSSQTLTLNEISGVPEFVN